jgi:hypothetical protein
VLEHLTPESDLYTYNLFYYNRLIAIGHQNYISRVNIIRYSQPTLNETETCIHLRCLFVILLTLRCHIQVKLNLYLLEGIHDDIDFCCKLAKEESVILCPGS